MEVESQTIRAILVNARQLYFQNDFRENTHPLLWFGDSIRKSIRKESGDEIRYYLKLEYYVWEAMRKQFPNHIGFRQRNQNLFSFNRAIEITYEWDHSGIPTKGYTELQW